MTKSITVLIADDHGVVCEGLQAVEAATGREAIEQVNAHGPSCPARYSMPDLVDGLQALSAIKEAQSQTAVIMLTSHTYPAYLTRVVSLDATGFLSKEVDPNGYA
ncbi:MAG: response regulator transcription factor [Chloroflexi bacterium]|nr:response regulator transcription factor [Chloroflexota bacterium]